MKPSAVPVRPTEQPRRMLFTAACWSYQLPRKGLRFSSVKPPSAQKVASKSFTKG